MGNRKYATYFRKDVGEAKLREVLRLGSSILVLSRTEKNFLKVLKWGGHILVGKFTLSE